MRTYLSLYLSAMLIVLLNPFLTWSQGLTGYTFKVVDMMPKWMSNETGNDAETNVAVNPANTSIIAGSAFTLNPTGSKSTAPIYISTDGGSTWSLKNIVPSENGVTGDISLG